MKEGVKRLSDGYCVSGDCIHIRSDTNVCLTCNMPLSHYDTRTTDHTNSLNFFTDGSKVVQ